jgi:hypothetical protein
MFTNIYEIGIVHGASSFAKGVRRGIMKSIPNSSSYNRLKTSIASLFFNPATESLLTVGLAKP